MTNGLENDPMVAAVEDELGKSLAEAVTEPEPATKPSELTPAAISPFPRRSLATPVERLPQKSMAEQFDQLDRITSGLRAMIRDRSVEVRHAHAKRAAEIQSIYDHAVVAAASARDKAMEIADKQLREATAEIDRMVAKLP